MSSICFLCHKPMHKDRKGYEQICKRCMILPIKKVAKHIRVTPKKWWSINEWRKAKAFERVLKYVGENIETYNNP